jgi:clusterin-associated protein 1
MTFREVRQFVEIVRTLGYAAAIGVDSFDVPDFGLMADLLQWLSTLYDPDIVLIPDLTNEHGRVELVRSIVQQLAIRSGIRLNPRKLYQSDRFAVRELLKIASPIYRGITSSPAPESSPGGPKKPPSAQKISQLSATVPKHSVELYDQLNNELTVRESRTKVLSTMPPLDDVEKSVIGAVDGATTRLEMLTKEVDRLNTDEDTLRSKIKQRKHDLERQAKRLMSVRTLRPAFMDEYESLEQELQELFRVHFQHYRNVDFYEHELQKAAEKQKLHKAKADRQIVKVRKRVGQEIIGNIQQSFNLQQQQQPTAGAPIADSDSGDELRLPAVEEEGSDDSF